MLQYKVILFLSLLHQLVICSNVNKIAQSSEESSATDENSVINANAWRNFTELFRSDQNEFKFPNDTTFLNNIKSADDGPWDLDRVLDIWNPITVSRFWNNETYRDAKISLLCGEDLVHYMMGVSKRRIWAQKSKHNLIL